LPRVPFTLLLVPPVFALSTSSGRRFKRTGPQSGGCFSRHITARIFPPRSRSGFAVSVTPLIRRFHAFFFASPRLTCISIFSKPLRHPPKGNFAHFIVCDTFPLLRPGFPDFSCLPIRVQFPRTFLRALLHSFFFFFFRDIRCVYISFSRKSLRCDY